MQRNLKNSNRDRKNRNMTIDNKEERDGRENSKIISKFKDCKQKRQHSVQFIRLAEQYIIKLGLMKQLNRSVAPNVLL